MKHGVYGRKLGRKTNHRIAMWRNMATALFTHNQITTTIPKAKSLQPFVEKLITAAKKGDLASRRRVIAKLGGDTIMIRDEDDENVERNKYGEVTGGTKIVKHLFDEIAPRYADRNGGYTRIIKLGISRIGDGSDLCVIQLVGTEEAGPQVSGSNSRRRDKANKRMEFAAKLRKGDAEEAAEEEAPAEEATATAVAEAPEAEAPETEAPAEEAAAEETEEKKGE
ncbi:50S ribosomal protein L17 [Algisphaera agarilytica]|uniref:Large ribosomal subunit protein bL17 n=1 Tax=Algisphaera agarilytica TaxID=1385975 RepID=A0A7X0H858_9BACT|nr:large subunit ribosomal protein L17 [Algisphaera agarilytica]